MKFDCLGLYERLKKLNFYLSRHSWCKKLLINYKLVIKLDLSWESLKRFKLIYFWLEIVKTNEA